MVTFLAKLHVATPYVVMTAVEEAVEAAKKDLAVTLALVPRFARFLVPRMPHAPRPMFARVTTVLKATIVLRRFALRLVVIMHPALLQTPVAVMKASWETHVSIRML